MFTIQGFQRSRRWKEKNQSAKTALRLRAVAWDELECHLILRPSRQAMTSSSARTASATGTTERTSKVKAGSIEQNLWSVNGSSQSTSKYPPQSPTRITKNSILKLAGAFHCPKTSRIRV